MDKCEANSCPELVIEIFVMKQETGTVYWSKRKGWKFENSNKQLMIHQQNDQVLVITETTDPPDYSIVSMPTILCDSSHPAAEEYKQINHVLNTFNLNIHKKTSFD